jgi:alpha-galactosidase
MSLFDQLFDGLPEGLEVSPLQGNTRDGLEAVVLKSRNTKLQFALHKAPRRAFLNGWQSWTESRVFELDTNWRGLRWPAGRLLEPYGDYGFKSYESGQPHSWTYCSWEYEDATILLASLNEQEGMTCISWKSEELHIEKEATESGLSLILIKGPTEQAYACWQEALGIPAVNAPAGIGWTSWYRHYTNITRQSILDDLAGFREQNIPLDFFQIDDGWQPAVGDWMQSNEKFPGGMKELASAIAEAGYTPGLWLAPFVAERKSALFRKHPEWLLRDRKGKPVKAGYTPLWSGTFYALDCQHAGLKEHLREVFRQIFEDWGFGMVKLDFLYAAGLGEQVNRGQRLHSAMRFLRDICPGRMLACGVPLAPVMGLADYCRIGADVHLKWEHRLLAFLRNRERVSTILALRNSIGRAALSGKFFRNDPDVFILRSEGHKLDRSEQQTLLLVNMLFGELIFQSDDAKAYSPAEWQLFQSLFPLVPRENLQIEDRLGQVRVRFRIEEKRYLAFLNLRDEKWQPKFEELRFCAWKRSLESGPIDSLAPHSSRLFLLPDGEEGTILGSVGHYFPGAELNQGAWRKGLLCEARVWISDFDGPTQIDGFRVREMRPEL